MRRGTRPKPTALKQLEGNPGKRALNKNEPKGRGTVSNPPAHLNEEQAKAWNEIVIRIPAGIATSTDDMVIETLAMSIAHMRSGHYSTAVACEIRKACAELGMTPSSRATLSTPDEKEDNPYADFMN